ncbi:MAG: pentapeptide repeat-containing protein [Bradyrhizobium sp.]
MSDSENPVLKPSNENPWYCLATIHGEQTSDEIDSNLARKNRDFWNRWIDAAPHDHQLRAEIEASFAKRTKSFSLPDKAETADFSRTKFDRAVDFGGFLFRRPVDFHHSTFSGTANFAGAHFEGNSNFSFATFSRQTNFKQAQFNAALVDFNSATFSYGAEFQYASFVHCTFAYTKFGEVNFGHAKFAVAFFGSAIFSAAAYFGSTKFEGDAAIFRSATFSSSVAFNSAKFSNEADFFDTKFSDKILFTNATFSGHTKFVNARFENYVPDFRGATIHQATEWHGATWPKPPAEEGDAQEQVYAYERLKQEMEQLKKHEDEQVFFRQELRARRGLTRLLSGRWLLNFAYQWSSRYGSSVGRPVLWLLLLFTAGAAIFARAPIHCGAPMPIRLAVKLSFANIFVFLPDKREIMTLDMVACLSDTTRAVSAIQSISGVALLFLLGLAIRNRFRMK